MCAIEPHVLGVQAFGNVAVVFTLEVPRRGTDQRNMKTAARQANANNPDLAQDISGRPGFVPDLPMLLTKVLFPRLANRSKPTPTTPRDQGDASLGKSPSRILSMTTLRNTNQMWRIWSHHTTLIDSAAFLGNPVDVAALVREKQAVMAEVHARANALEDKRAVSSERRQSHPRSMKDVITDVLAVSSLSLSLFVCAVYRCHLWGFTAGCHQSNQREDTTNCSVLGRYLSIRRR